MLYCKHRSRHVNIRYKNIFHTRILGEKKPRSGLYEEKGD